MELLFGRPERTSSKIKARAKPTSLTGPRCSLLVGQSQPHTVRRAECAARLVTGGPLFQLFPRLSVPLLPDHNHTSSGDLVLQVGLSSSLQVTVHRCSLSLTFRRILVAQKTHQLSCCLQLVRSLQHDRLTLNPATSSFSYSLTAKIYHFSIFLDYNSAHGLKLSLSFHLTTLFIPCLQIHGWPSFS